MYSLYTSQAQYSVILAAYRCGYFHDKAEIMPIRQRYLPTKYGNYDDQF